MYQCNATIGQEKGEFGFVPVRCTQTVGTRAYWEAGARERTNTDHLVAYCSIPGHEEQVRRRFPEGEPPMPVFLHEDPDYADPVTLAKAEADREETWTLA